MDLLDLVFCSSPGISLELASKNGFISSLFKGIKEMLLRLYYLYKKSPKKVRELKSIVKDLKEVFDFRENGYLPVYVHKDHSD